MQPPIIIIGTGLAGYQLAKEFRKLDKTTPLTLITENDGHFYSKPMLSSAMTAGKTSETLVTADAKAMASQLQAEIIVYSKVTAIDAVAKNIFIDEKKLSFSKAVLACGADVIKPPLRGNAIADVVSVNNLHDYANFRHRIKDKKRIVILGAGLIGCEFANDLTNAGYEVHVVAPAKTPLDLLIPAEIGALLQQGLTKNGVYWHLQQVVDEINKIEQGYHLQLSSGDILDADVVLSAIGLRPHTALAQTAGIQVQRGILVNRYLQTSVADIYALGDCAEVEGHVLPYIAPLLNCTRALAKTLAGELTPVDYPAMPVIVKTPAHPLVVLPPPYQLAGTWKIEGTNDNVRALFYDETKQLRGFILTNAAVSERMTLAKQIPPLF